MAFTSLYDVITMSGHGFYVWLAFSVSVFLIVFLFLWPSYQQRILFREIAAQMERDQLRSSIEEE